MIRLGIGDVRYSAAPGAEVPPGHVPLSRLRLLILVGMTGAGKTTTLEALAALGGGFACLPERRVLADSIVIPAVLAEEPGCEPPTDRIARLALTRRFRDRHPGGFAHILAHMTVAAPTGVSRFLFDGLRGPEEISHALEALPMARLAVLDIPDGVRLCRLLGRHERFDDLGPGEGLADDGSLFGEDCGIPEAERAALLAAVPRGAYPPREVRDKIRIIAEERKSYRMDRVAGIARADGAGRMLYIDDPGLSPADIAGMIAPWWEAERGESARLDR